MAYSSGTRTLFAEVAGWAAVALLAVGIFTNYDSLKTLAVAHFGAGPASTVLPARATAPTDVHQPSGSSVALRSAENGHYHTRADINGRQISAMVDTGASMVVLTYDDARTAGIYLRPSDFVQAASTANGTAKFAPVTLDRVSIGGITVRNVRAAVADKGRLGVTLLGMSFLSKLQRVDMRDGVMMLQD